MIKIKFLGPFSKVMKDLDKDGYWNVEPNNQTIGEILMATNIKDIKMNYSVVVNSTKQGQDYMPKDGDVLSIIPLFFAG